MGRINPKNGKLLYHITRVDNIGNIVKEGLKTRNNLESAEDKKFGDTANHEILEKRKEGNLDEYVPFHFFEGCPYDGRVKKDNPDHGFAIICVTRDKVKDNCIIINGHPLNHTQIEKLDWDEGMKQIDWDLIDKREYSDEACKQACMSEALYKGDMPSSLFQSIKVPDQKTKDNLEKIKKELNLSFFVNIDNKLIAENKKNEKH
jgi:hypothetical protein